MLVPSSLSAQRLADLLQCAVQNSILLSNICVSSLSRQKIPNLYVAERALASLSLHIM